MAPEIGVCPLCARKVRGAVFDGVWLPIRGAGHAEDCPNAKTFPTAAAAVDTVRVPLGKVGPVRLIAAGDPCFEEFAQADDSVHVYASRDGVELLAVPCRLTPGEAVTLIKKLVDALHAVDVLELAAAQAELASSRISKGAP